MRWLRHLVALSPASRFPPAALKRIGEAIAAGEATHTGQVRFAVESRLPMRALWRATPVRERALSVFSRLRVWDTQANNGVLVYLLLADHCIELVADRGVPVPGEAWNALCERMAARLRAGEFEGAVIETVETVSGWLARDFPRGGDAGRGNELPDDPTLLG